MKLTGKQLLALKYYEGDVSGKDPFWGDPKAYVTINSLFFDGAGTEQRRAAEKKYLNPAIIEDPERLMDLCRNLLSAFHTPDLRQPRISYRVERYADYLEMKAHGCTVSFTSTSTGGFLSSYGDRIGIALIEFEIPAGIPCFPFAEMLKEEYKKTEEQEILLPPGLALEIREIPLQAEDTQIHDAKGNPPLVKAHIRVAGYAQIPGSADESKIPDTESVNAGIRLYQALNTGTVPSVQDTEKYIAWKKNLRNYLLEEFRKGSGV